MSASRHAGRAFTLVEMLLVIGIVSILAATLLPVIGRTSAKARRLQCLSNLRQTGIAFHSFLHEHADGFPMEVSTNAGGTREVAEAAYRTRDDYFYLSFVHFQALSNDLANPNVLVCPADLARTPAGDFPALNNRMVSYFAGANADYSLANSILAGDRNILSRAPGPQRSLVRLDGDNPAVWTGELHAFKGNELYADGHAERVNAPNVRLPVRNAPAVMDLIVPSVKPAGSVRSALAKWENGLAEETLILEP